MTAAAPELLAVAKECLELAELAESLTGCRGDDDYVRGIQERLHAAIAKAEGICPLIAQRTPAHFCCPAWPGCDCPDGSVDPNCPGLETLTIPPGNRKALVCEDYPDCGCEGDCELPPLRVAGKPERVIALMLAGLAVLGSILLWLELRL